jgi:hypothetical protein
MSTTQQRGIQVRVSDDIWAKAKAKANGEGTTISARIRGWLIEYVNDPDDLYPYSDCADI